MYTNCRGNLKNGVGNLNSDGTGLRHVTNDPIQWVDCPCLTAARQLQLTRHLPPSCSHSACHLMSKVSDVGSIVKAIIV